MIIKLKKKNVMNDDIFFSAVAYFHRLNKPNFVEMLYQLQTHCSGAGQQLNRMHDIADSTRQNLRPINPMPLFNDIHFYFICVANVKKDFEHIRAFFDKCQHSGGLKEMYKKYKYFFELAYRMRGDLEHFKDHLSPEHLKNFSNVRIGSNSILYILGSKKNEINFKDNSLFDFINDFERWIEKYIKESRF